MLDALLGHHSRPHQDLDLVIARDDAAAAQAALAGLGFQPDPATVPGLPARVLLADPDGRQVDLHLVVFDAQGNGWQELGEGAWGAYPAEELTGAGRGSGDDRCAASLPGCRSVIISATHWTPPTATTWDGWPSGSGWRCPRSSSPRAAGGRACPGHRGPA
jgi:hypothetical protein